jgi:hypothetical protein
LSALLRTGLTGEALGGLLDRCGERWLVFDLDGTRQTVLERAVPDDARFGTPRRRRRDATAPGYTGRKRGDAVRTRLSVQQSHTTEWLGAFSAAGNGRIDALVPFALYTIATYLAARGVEGSRALLRFDGEHGHPVDIHRLVTSGLCFVLRGVHYAWLEQPAVRAALEAGTYVSMTHPDTGVTRQVFDVPEVPCGNDPTPRTVRVIVTRRAYDANRPVRVGVRRGEWIYELFVSNAPSSAFHAADLVALYLHRGAFEATLAHEDQEVPTDRWITDAPHGEDLWQLVTQAVWNLRIRLGWDAIASPRALNRCTDFTPAVTIHDTPVTGTLPEPTPAETDPAPSAESPRGAPAVAVAEADVPLEASGPESSGCPPAPEPELVETPTPAIDAAAIDPAATPPEASCGDPSPTGPRDATPRAFVRGSDGTMQCPAGQTMRRVETVRVRGLARERWQAEAAQCGACRERIACRGPNSERAVGRRLTLAPTTQRVEVQPNARAQIPRTPKPPKLPKPPKGARTPAPATPAPVAVRGEATRAPPHGTGLRWYDVAARALRREVASALTDRVVEIRWNPDNPTPRDPEPPAMLSRDERAHRRHTREWSQLRNARRADQTTVALTIRGLPKPIAEFLAIPTNP